MVAVKCCCATIHRVVAGPFHPSSRPWPDSDIGSRWHSVSEPQADDTGGLMVAHRPQPHCYHSAMLIQRRGRGLARTKECPGLSKTPSMTVRQVPTSVHLVGRVVRRIGRTVYEPTGHEVLVTLLSINEQSLQQLATVIEALVCTVHASFVPSYFVWFSVGTESCPTVLLDRVEFGSKGQFGE